MADIAIIGGGPAGLMCAIAAIENNPNHKITIFEKNMPLKSILATGGGRCNLTFADFDYKSLASNFYRGEKFLYSVFSRFGVAETLEWFDRHKLKTYIQEDFRVFPKSNKAVEVRDLFLNLAKKHKIEIFDQIVVSAIEKDGEKFNVHSGSNVFSFDKIVIATGGNRLKSKATGYVLAKQLGHKITDLRPSLCGLEIKNKEFNKLEGVSFQNAQIKVYFENKFKNAFNGDFLFTRKGVSGPVIYKISSFCAMMNYTPQNPLELFIDWVQEDIENEFLNMLSKNSNKDILNIVSVYVPKSLAGVLLTELDINHDKKANQISKKEREKIIEMLKNTPITVPSPVHEGEIVTAGGVELNEINPKTMESKIVPNLYFCGEIINIDGLTGGFNLQNCWSTGYLAGINL